LEVKKQFIGKKPNTSYKVTQQGIKAFKNHLDTLEKLIKIKF
jgi:predicted transcriptional regulator